MKTVLIAYVSHGGQTEKIARRVADTLALAGHVAELVDLEHSRQDVDMKRFQSVVVAAPIYAGGYPRAALKFARRHRDALRGVPTVFVSVGLAVASRTHDGRAQTMPLVEKFLQKAGFRPERIELVAGSLLYTRYNFLKRYIMLRIARAEGGDTDISRDYEYTNWAALERFAMELGADLERGASRRVEPDPLKTSSAA